MTEHSAPLTPGEVADLLAAAATTLQAELTALPARVARQQPAPGEWSAQEVLGHLLEAERRGFAGRIRAILAEPEPALASWDAATVARERRDHERDLAGLLDEFLAERAASVALVRSLRAADLDRGGRHPAVGYLRVGDLLHEWVHHDRNHLRQLLANVQAGVWPHMGNAQRFSDS